MDEFTPTTEDIRSSYPLSDKDKVTHPALAWDRIITVEGLDRWLTAHDAEIRTAALEEAALALIGHIGIQTTNGIGWIPGDSKAGAARYLRHLARAAKDGKR